MQKVFILDDHSSVRVGVAMLMERAGWEVSAEAGSLEEARRVAASRPWSVAIIDQNLPDGEGISFVQELRDSGMRAPVLVHSMVPDAAAAGRALKAGANGFINKGCSPEELLTAVRTVASGETYVSKDYAQQLARGVATGGGAALHESLSAREFKIMCLLAQGKPGSVVASEAGVAVGTVSSYRSRIFKKLNVSSGVELARYAIQHRLVGQ